MSGTLPSSAIVFGIFLAAIVQIVVHMHYFLHLDTSSAERWNVMALAYTVLIVAILVGGTLWIMYNTHIRMMDAATMAPAPAATPLSGAAPMSGMPAMAAR